MEIPERILVELKDIAQVMGEKTDWLIFKKAMLLQLPPVLRKKFSTRDPKTKKQSLNTFEKELIKVYKKYTGIELVLTSHKES